MDVASADFRNFGSDDKIWIVNESGSNFDQPTISTFYSSSYEDDQGYNFYTDDGEGKCRKEPETIVGIGDPPPTAAATTEENTENSENLGCVLQRILRDENDVTPDESVSTSDSSSQVVPADDVDQPGTREEERHTSPFRQQTHFTIDENVNFVENALPADEITVDPDGSTFVNLTNRSSTSKDKTQPIILNSSDDSNDSMKASYLGDKYQFTLFNVSTGGRQRISIEQQIVDGGKGAKEDLGFDMSCLTHSEEFTINIKQDLASGEVINIETDTSHSPNNKSISEEITDEPPNLDIEESGRDQEPVEREMDATPASIPSTEVPVKKKVHHVKRKKRSVSNKRVKLQVNKRPLCDKPFGCMRCGESFATCEDLDAHALTHARPNVHACRRCGKEYPNRHKLLVHITEHTVLKPSLTRGVVNPDFTVRPPQPAFTTSDLPPKAKRGRPASTNRTKKHHLSLQQKLEKLSKRYKCRFCGAQFTSCDELVRHVTIHAGEQSCECETCGKQFTSNESLAKHLEKHVEDLNNPRNELPNVDFFLGAATATTGLSFSCEICGKSFNTLNRYQNHQRTHTGETPYLCQQCGTRFSMKGHLTRHIKRNKCGTPFQCFNCGHAFRTNLELKNHVATTHPQSQEFTCLECGRGFDQEYYFVKHTQMHIQEETWRSAHIDLPSDP